MAYRVVIMSDGVIEEIGTPREIFQNPAAQFVAEFVGGNNILEGTIASPDAKIAEINTAFRQIYCHRIKYGAIW